MSAPQTSPTLLRGLQDNTNDHAWRLFTELYSPFIFSIARGNGLNAIDAQDAVQETLLRCARSFCTFEYNAHKGRFRSWLRTITTNVIHDQRRSRARQVVGTGDTDVLKQLDQQPGREPEPAGRMISLETEARDSQALQAMIDTVRTHLTEEQWPLFCATWIESLPDAIVAEKLGKTEGAVRVARYRIRKSLEQLRDQMMNPENE